MENSYPAVEIHPCIDAAAGLPRARSKGPTLRRLSPADASLFALGATAKGIRLRLRSVSFERDDNFSPRASPSPLQATSPSLARARLIFAFSIPLAARSWGR